MASDLDLTPHDQPDQLAPVDTRFIPARPRILARTIEADPSAFGPAAPHARALRDAIDRVIGQEVETLHDHLDDLYAALNPDEDAHSVATEDPVSTQAHLLERLGYVLDKANFETLDDVQIDAAIAAGTSYGFRVRLDPDRIEHLALHVRGRGVASDLRRLRVKPWKRVERRVPVYRRLVAVAQLKGEGGIRLKLFRDIPVRDIEALLPHAEISMSMLDRAQVFGGGAGALGGLVSKIMAAGAFTFTGLGSAAAIAFGGLAFKSFMGYRRTKHKRTSQRTQHLYERNLANNAAVVHSLLRMIRQEEVKEALLVYALLSAEHTPRDEHDLDVHAEHWIAQRFGCTSDFDCPDALETLDRLGLWQDRARLLVVSPAEALDRLESHWIHRRSLAYHLGKLGLSQER